MADHADEPISPERRVLEHAGAQHMLVSRQQCVEAGLSAYQIRRRLCDGLWLEVHSNVFAVHGMMPTAWEPRVLAAVLAIPGAVAARRTALWLQGVEALGMPEPIEVSAPRGCAVRLDGVRVAQHRSLPAADRTVVRGIPSTGPTRTVIDLAAGLEWAMRVTVLEEIIDRRKVQRRTFVRRARAASRGRAGVRSLVEVADDGAAVRFRSWLEREGARVWAQAGLPAPRWNVILRDRRGSVIGEIDAVFPGGVVTVELDGLKFHSTPAQRRKDQQRDRALLLSGRIPLRYDWKDIVGRPDVVVEEIRLALEQSGCGSAG